MNITLYIATDSDNITYLHSGKPKRKPVGWAYGGKRLMILGENVDGQTWEDEPKKIEINTERSDNSGYAVPADGSPKCLNKNCNYYNEKFDMNCDANEDLCEKCLGTSHSRKRCRTFEEE